MIHSCLVCIYFDFFIINCTLEHFTTVTVASLLVKGCQALPRRKLHWAMSKLLEMEHKARMLFDLCLTWFYTCWLQLPHPCRYPGLCSSLWWHWGICATAGGQEALEAVPANVNIYDMLFISIVVIIFSCSDDDVLII